MKKLLFPLFLLTLVAFAGCKKKTTAFNLHTDYFPIVRGQYVVYEVREVKIDKSLNLNDTSRYFIKTLIGDTIMDNSGRIARRFERYKRVNANDAWVLKDIWTTILVGKRVELVEENQRVIKLVLAPDKNKEWDMNAYNTLGTINCYYENIHDPAYFNGYSFDSTVRVVQQDDLNFIQFRKKYELYAKGVGMYYKHYKDYSINNFDSTDIRKGNEITMKLLSYGRE